MAVFYADSSVLVKRHLPEQGSAWFRALTAPRSGNRIETARLSLVEIVSAFNRRVREGTLQPADYLAVRDDFLARCRRSYRLVPMTNALLGRTRVLLERHPLCTYDALHLASALAGMLNWSVQGDPASPSSPLMPGCWRLRRPKGCGLITQIITPETGLGWYGMTFIMSLLAASTPRFLHRSVFRVRS